MCKNPNGNNFGFCKASAKIRHYNAKSDNKSDLSSQTLESGLIKADVFFKILFFVYHK
jgi:hypothetical protein